LAQIRHLRNAPIVEALIDIRVEARQDFRGELFEEVKAAVATEYPKVEERRGVTLQLAFGGPQPQPQVQQHGLDGFFFRSADEKEVIQFRSDGFTFNRLQPYTSWEQILPPALRFLEMYLKSARPRAINRVATRYINRIRLPSPRFEEYLTSPPRGVPGTRGSIAGFTEVAVTSEHANAMVTFTQSIEASVPAMIWWCSISSVRSQRCWPMVSATK